MKKLNLKKLSFVACLLVLLATILPFLILGSNSFLTIHDNLDSDVVWFQTLTESDHVFDFSNEAKVDNVMNGLPRNSLPPAFNFITILFLVFSPFWAFVVNSLLVRLVAFFSLRFLLRKYVFSEKEYFYSDIISLGFAVLPFYGLHPGLAIAGIPLVAILFTLFWKDSSRYYHYLLLVAFCFYSSLIYTGVFMLIIASLFFIYALVIKKEVKSSFLLGIVVMAIGYVIGELNLVTQFVSGFESHRLLWQPSGLDFVASLIPSIQLFINGYYHAPTLNTPFILGIYLLAFILAFRQGHKDFIKKSSLVMGAILGICLIFLLWDFKSFAGIINAMPFGRAIQWNRFYWLLPFIWFLLKGTI